MVRRLTVVALLLSSTLVFGAANGAWLKRVPAQERARPNPYAECGNAVAAGAILYKRSCFSCHGDEARGIGRHPSLRTARVQDATDGELHWLLTKWKSGTRYAVVVAPAGRSAVAVDAVSTLLVDRRIQVNGGARRWVAKDKTCQ
jgi:mono/diheme cytochrome c family protein